MRILIVDDEPLVRIGIKSAIPWETHGMEIVGEAADGEEAIRLMIQHKPDVILLDIKMPKKDGIEVLQDMKRIGIEAKSIILSSFDDFVFVKRAMQLGAVDYFHKPSMNVNDIVDVLKKMQSQLEPHQEKQIERGFGKGDALRNMLHGKTEDAHQTKLNEGNLHVIVFSIKNYAQVSSRYTNDNITLLPNTIINILSELLAKEKEAEFTKIDGNLFALAISNIRSKSEQATLTYVNDLIQLIHSSLKRFVNIDTVFGTSDSFNTFVELKEAFKQAKQSLSQKFYRPDLSIFHYHHNSYADEEMLEQAMIYIRTMKTGLRENNPEQFITNLMAWEQFLQEKECMTEQDVRKIYDFILFMTEHEEKYTEYRNKAEEIEDFKALIVFYRPIFDKQLNKDIIANRNKYSPIVRNILLYVEQNYNQDISLKILSQQFNVSSNYISRLFSQEFGRGLFDYMNEVRVEKAKDLLKDYRYKIYEIAEMVGFNSHVHFAIVFNKYVGISPKEYRKEKG
ncbi:response regulator transcription factor [Paenibacillus macquariensis]|uniref:Two-component response regulator, YesN/AraC family, consists of REC and AraC-type DNA-binding domains n=1 Tax=Paenibacillus macquariensis TaxID=948756 RepID=A0ABY1JNU0_9BACL|nr:response regulator [Paenibacillus macquariensis]MEC0092114.1 response regulator [Paenibacillus macquariensis]OAB37325.1 DNA-binding response regulator [Paenibacillus macquariensis subsp. macquariensis]SIQ50869.1 Two-component response regulator, YesN/AraC family, consists of REC and AraC-type DNA-binding domains [Paenibacillus macquariensis]